MEMKQGKKQLTCWEAGIWMTPVSFDGISLNAHIFEAGNYPYISDF